MKNQIDKEEKELVAAKDAFESNKKHLEEKKKFVELNKKSLADGQLTKKQVVVKKMVDGVKEIIDPKTGLKKYIDKNGKEINANDAFREIIVEVNDDGDAAEFEIDPKTGKVVKKKQQ